MPPKKNRFFTCLGCIVAGPLGCLAFLGGGAAVSVVFLPDLVAHIVERDLPAGFGESFEGDLELGDVELSWTSRQRVDGFRLLDPEGREVLSGDASLPSILRILREQDLGAVELELAAHLVVAEDGSTNLERAFAPRPDTELDTGWRWRNEISDLYEHSGELRVDLRRLEVESPRFPNGAPIAISNVDAILTFGPGKPVELEVLGATDGGPLRLDAAFAREALAATGSDPGVSGRFFAQGLPTALFELWPELGAADLVQLGERADVLLELGPLAVNADGASGAPLTAEFLSGETRLVLGSGELSGSGLLARSPRGRLRLAEAKLSGVRAGALARYCGDALALEWLGAEPIRLRDVELAWPASATRASAPTASDASAGSSASEDPLAESAQAEHATVELPALALSRAGGERRLAVHRTTIAVRPAGADGMRELALTAELAPNGSSELGLVVRTRAPLAELVAFELGDSAQRGEAAPTYELHAEGVALPLAELASWLGLAAPLAPALGATVDVQLDLGSGPERSPLTARFETDTALVELRGSLAGSPFERANLVRELDLEEARIAGVPASALRPFLPWEVELDWSGSEAITAVFEGWRARASTPVTNGAQAGAEHGRLSVFVPELVFATPELARADEHLALRNLTVAVTGGSEAVQIDSAAELVDGGSVEEHWTLFAPRGPFGLDGCEDVDLRAQAIALPARIVDAQLGGNGLVAGVFGPALGLVLSSQPTSDRVRFELQAESPRASATLEGVHERRVQVSSAELTLDCDLDESSFRALVQPLLPLLARAEPQAIEQRFGLSISDGVFPLDGDPLGIEGACRLDFAGARVELVPSIRSKLAPEVAARGALPILGPIELALRAGRVRCEAVALPLEPLDAGGLALELEGDYAFGGADADLWTELDLRVIGPDVSAVLHASREILRPDWKVPIVLTGDAPDFELAVRPQWIRTVSDVLGGMVPDIVKENIGELLQEQQ